MCEHFDNLDKIEETYVAKIEAITGRLSKTNHKELLRLVEEYRDAWATETYLQGCRDGEEYAKEQVEGK